MQCDYRFEWSLEKNLANEKKHDGISFVKAQSIWDDPLFVEVHLFSDPEERWAVIGQVGKGRFLTAIITYRGEIIRIISARRSSKKEIEVYAGYSWRRA